MRTRRSGKKRLLTFHAWKFLGGVDIKGRRINRLAVTNTISVMER
jgi:hypothetical protein